MMGVRPLLLKKMEQGAFIKARMSRKISAILRRNIHFELRRRQGTEALMR